jgi:serine/threonine protein kinase
MRDDRAESGCRAVFPSALSRRSLQPLRPDGMLQSACPAKPDPTVADDPHSTLPPPATDPHATRFPGKGEAGLGEPSAPQVADRDPACRLVGNYVIERELGRGGMGVVYLATHAEFRDRRYAVKLMSSALASPNAHELFRREVQAVGQSQHPNLLYAIDAGMHDGSLYLVTEFVEGQDIGRILGDRGPLPLPFVYEIGRQIATGLAFAHTNGIVHRDIKPQNVILHPSGVVKILDLGLAAVRDATGGDLRAEAVVGKPAYMPPEQWRRGDPVSAATDMYALGCTLFEMLTGQTPFPVSDHPDLAAQRKAHLELEPPPRRSKSMPLRS